jgi:hypothetical protein
MARDEGMALCPWGALGGGNFSTKAKQQNNEQGRNFGGPSEAHLKTAEKLEAVAKAKNTQITSVALAYVRSKYPYVYPIVGGRKIEHLKGNIEALGLELSAEDIKEIESAVDFDIGFPMNFLFGLGKTEKYNSNMTSSDVSLLAYAGNLESVPHQQQPKPHQLQGFGHNE